MQAYNTCLFLLTLGVKNAVCTHRTVVSQLYTSVTTLTRVAGRSTGDISRGRPNHTRIWVRLRLAGVSQGY